MGWIRTVARYARITITAEQPVTKWLTMGMKPTAATALMSEARQLEDRLGLNPKHMRQLGWEIATDADQGADGDAADVLNLDSFRARVGS